MPTGIVIRQSSKSGSRPRRHFAKRPSAKNKPTVLEQAVNRSLLKECVRAVRGQCVLCLKLLPDGSPERHAWWNILQRAPVDIVKLSAKTLPDVLPSLLAALRPVHEDCLKLAPAANPPPAPMQARPKLPRGPAKARIVRGFEKSI